MIGVLESDETIGVLNFKVNLPGLVRVSETIPQNEKSSNRRLIERKKWDGIDCFIEFVCDFS